jgi:hypothetical protein
MMKAMVDRSALLLSLAFIILAVSSLLAMVADISVHQAQRLERRWEQANSVPDVSQWFTAKSYLQAGLLLSPGHPDYSQALGRLYSWSYFTSDELTVNPESGLSYFIHATDVRPYWAFGWGEFLLLKAQLGQVDQAFSDVFDAAMETGRYESKVMLNLLNAGLGSWELLSWQQRSDVMLVFKYIVQGNYHTREQALKIAEWHSMKQEMCLSIVREAFYSVIERQCRA